MKKCVCGCDDCQRENMCCTSRPFFAYKKSNATSLKDHEELDKGIDGLAFFTLFRDSLKAVCRNEVVSNKIIIDSTEYWSFASYDDDAKGWKWQIRPVVDAYKLSLTTPRPYQKPRGRARINKKGVSSTE